MDRRFFTWLMLTTAMFFLYLSMRPKNPANQQDAKPAPAIKDPLAATPQGEQGQAEVSTDTDVDGRDSVEASEKPTFPARTVTLGSMDPTKGYHLMVSLSSQGAAVQRAELVKQLSPGKFAYRALEHKGGYLGYLGLSSDLRISTIPDGSPAQQARGESPLQVGDKLIEVNGQELLARFSVDAALEKTKPGDEIEFKIERTIAGSASTHTYTATLTEAPLDVLRTYEREAEFIAGNDQRRSLRTTLGSLNGNDIPFGAESFPSLADTLNANWEVRELEVPGGEGVEFRLPLDALLFAPQPNKIDLVKRYRLLPAQQDDDPNAFLLDLETVIENRNETAIQASFRQEGVTGLTLEGWWYSVKISPYMFSAAGQRDVAYWSEAAYHQLKTTRQIVDHAKDTPAQPNLMLLGDGEPPEYRKLNYLGIDSQYFNASIIPHSEDGDALSDLRQAAAHTVADTIAIPKSKLQAANTAFWFDTAAKQIPSGGQLSQRYNIFIGPKATETLEAHGLGSVIEYGWFPWIAKPLSAILHFFHSIVGNYAVAIVMLTLMVRGLMFPLGRKAAANAQRMQELQPELKKINDKYKDNMEKRAKAMQELYAKHNFKPLAGCLPMFIQLPIFIGLYRCLSVDISLRQEPLWEGLSWCSNLAGPDMLADWSSWMPEFIAGKGTGWLGPYFNVLPICTVVLFILQQRFLMPKATDEQTRMTQNMMQVMTIFMGVLFFKVPSGLCIYFITSSLWSLLERQLVKRTLPPKPAEGESGAGSDDTSDSPAPSSTNGKGGKANRKKGRAERQAEEKPKSRFDELKQMLEKPAVKSATQRSTSKGPATKGGKKRRKRK